jgi:signal transduction histidine kinase
MEHTANLTTRVTSSRRPIAAVKADRSRLLVNPLLVGMLEAIPDAAMLLDNAGRLLLGNRQLVALLGGRDVEQFVGQRPGDALGCCFTGSVGDGCGTSRWCPHCGALQAIVVSRESGCQVTREVTLFLDAQTTLEVEVVATPLAVEGIAATFCVIRDISADKRRQVLEQVFFHDVMNTVGGLRGVAELLRRDEALSAADQSHYQTWLLELLEQLAEEIDQQRKLLAAERGEFSPEMSLLSVAQLLEQVRHTYANHSVAEGRILSVAPLIDRLVVSDQTILRRILGNLVKNALEAVPTGEEVVISIAEGEAGQITFQVANPGVIPDQIQRQLFSRGVSTKAAHGRGVGTYSAKLFTERYLSGRIGFTSSCDEGTKFWITIPGTHPA